MLLQIKNLSKLFIDPSGVRTIVLQDINFEIIKNNEHGFIDSILAPFGSGKTTLLKIIAALETPTEGGILLNGNNYLKPDGKIIYIPEKASSFPWLSVKQNIEFAFKLRQNDTIKTDVSTDEIIYLVGLKGYEDHIPHNKSLGFRFRISLARALALEPLIVLLDDPLKSMDSETKEEIIDLLKTISQQLKIVIVYATANVSESIKISNTIFLMKGKPGSIIKKISGFSEAKPTSEEFTSKRREIEDILRSANGVDSINVTV